MECVYGCWILYLRIIYQINWSSYMLSVFSLSHTHSLFRSFSHPLPFPLPLHAKWHNVPFKYDWICCCLHATIRINEFIYLILFYVQIENQYDFRSIVYEAWIARINDKNKIAYIISNNNNTNKNDAAEDAFFFFHFCFRVHRRHIYLYFILDIAPNTCVMQ